MPGFFIRWIVCAIGLWIAQALVGGITVDGTGSLILAALLLGLANAILRPLVVLLTLPLTIVTFGLFLWVINALMLSLVSYLMNGFDVATFGSALLGALVHVAVFRPLRTAPVLGKVVATVGVMLVSQALITPMDPVPNATPSINHREFPT